MAYIDLEFEFTLRNLKRDIKDLKKHPRDEVIRWAVYNSLQESWICHCELCSLSIRGFSETGKELQALTDQILKLVPTRGNASPVIRAIRRRAKEIQRDIKESLERGLRQRRPEGKQFASIRIDRMIQSQLQCMSPNASQKTGLSEGVSKHLVRLVGSVIELVKQVTITPKEKNEVAAQVQSIQGQMKSSKPNIAFVENCLSEIRDLVQTAPRSSARDELIDRIDIALELVCLRTREQ